MKGNHFGRGGNTDFTLPNPELSAVFRRTQGDDVKIPLEKVTELNKDVAAEGTQEKIDEAIAAFKAGELKVFDTSKFTVGGEKLTHMFAVDSDGDFNADKSEAVWDGVFHESYPEFQSAPYFTAVLDGITWLNAAY